VREEDTVEALGAIIRFQNRYSQGKIGLGPGVAVEKSDGEIGGGREVKFEGIARLESLHRRAESSGEGNQWTGMIIRGSK
jgi:hypothetical protein